MLSDFVISHSVPSAFFSPAHLSSPSFSSPPVSWGVLHTFALSSANAKTSSLNELGVRCKKVLDTNVKGIGQKKEEREREK